MLGWFGSSPEKTIRRLSKRVTEKYGPPENRQKALHNLVELGTPGAISVLLLRFTVKAEPGITDGEEKDFVYKAIVDLGSVSVEPLKEFVAKNETAVSWALKALTELVSAEEVVAVCVETLKRLGPDYTRDPEKKIVLIKHLACLNDPRIAPALLPFLEDPADDVRIAAASALGQLKDPSARVPLLELMARDAGHKRVCQTVAQALCEAGFGVQGYRETVESTLPDPFFVDKNGLVKRRG